MTTALPVAATKSVARRYKFLLGLALVVIAALVIGQSINITLAQSGVTVVGKVIPPLGDRLLFPLPAVDEDTTFNQVSTMIAAAQTTIAADATSVNAARVLGMAQTRRGQTSAAERSFLYAETLSRRDIVTELWLIEQDVQRGQVAAALTHYDRAMRTSDKIQQVLIPILAKAMDQPSVAGPLARVMAQRPPWWFDFMIKAVATAQSPASLLAVTRALALRPDHNDERLVLSSVISRLLTLKAPTAAGRLYGLVRHVGNIDLSMVRDGGFEQQPLLPPIDWSLTGTDGTMAGVIEPRSGRSGNVLTLAGTQGQIAAYQILVLPPGQYRLTLTAGAVSGAASLRPHVSLRCLSGATLLDQPLAIASASGHAMVFTAHVLSSCTIHMLTFSSGSDESADSATPSWVDDVAIRQIASGSVAAGG